MEPDSSRYFLSGTVAGASVRAAVTAAGLEIGRSHACGLMIADLEASRLHCVVRCAGDAISVEDRSQNGTFVNGVRIAHEAGLKVGDVVRIGATELTLCEGPVTVAAATTPVVSGAPAPVVPSAPAPEEKPQELQPGDTIDRYRIRRLIGKGGMGTVYEAVHTGLDLPRALKALTLPDDPTYAGFRQKFLDEGKILARLRHENITQVHDAAYDEKTRTLFFVMDLVLYDDGKPCTLADVAYDECDVSNWFASLASALDYIHGQGIVHSDLKLQNVLVSPGQKIKLADFGVAHLLSGKMRTSLRGNAESGGTETIGYTVHYVAPEILKDGVLPSVASDNYALGILLVKLLSGKWYDEDPSALALIAAKRALNWRPVLAQLLNRDPKRRATTLQPLVKQLRQGSKAPARRKFQIENRRRRSQKVHLKRAVNIKTNGIVSTPFVPESRIRKILKGAALLSVVLAAVVGLVWMRRDNARREGEERVRIERLNAARESACAKVAKAGEALAVRRAELKATLGPHKLDHAFVMELCRANATGETDRVTAVRRNDSIRAYGDVLRTIGAVRAALVELVRLGSDFDMRIQSCETADGLTALAAEFEAANRRQTEALDAAVADELRTWSAYGETKAQIDRERDLRAQIEGARRETLEAVRSALADEPALAAAAELAQARSRIVGGDRRIASATNGYESAADAYAEARELLARGCERLRAERAEREAIEASFRASDVDVRQTETARLRAGQSSLKVVASHVKDVSDRFAEKWKRECRLACNTGLVAECEFVLRSQAAYWEYLTIVMQQPHERLTFSITPAGVQVANLRYPYEFKWNDIFSFQKQDTRTKEQYRKLVVGRCNIPTVYRCSDRLLVGRWIAIREMMPAFNGESETNRLVEALRGSDNAAARVWACREFPEQFRPKEPAAAPPRLTMDDFPAALPAPKADPRQERLVFMAPSQGFVLSAPGSNGAGLSKCSRVKGTRKIRFQISGGEICGTDYGARRSVADVEEGQSFDVCADEAAGVCRYCPLQWIDNALGDGTALLLLSCQCRADEP